MTYHCHRCGDTMHKRFARSHERICRHVNVSEREAVERLLVDLFGTSA